MEDSDADARSPIGRRDFIGIGAGAAAAISMLNVGKASAQAPSSQGIPWWAARPGKGEWVSPRRLTCTRTGLRNLTTRPWPTLGQPLANPYPLDYDLDKRRQVDGRPWRPHALPDPLRRRCPGKELPRNRARISRKSSMTPAFKSTRNIPTVLSSAAELPIRDPELALKELNRVAGQPGVRAVHLPDSIERRDYIFDRRLCAGSCAH